MRSMRWMIGVFLLFQIFQTSICAQPLSEEPPLSDTTPPIKPEWKKREEVQDLIQAYKIMMVKRELELEKGQDLKFLLQMETLEEHKRAFNIKRRENLKQIQKALRDGVPDNNLKALVEEYQGLLEKFIESRKQDMRDLLNLLDIRQQARFLLLQDRIEKRVRDKIRQVLQKKRKRRENREPRPSDRPLER